MQTPAESGFRFPAEWEPHRGCWMAWPCEEETFAELSAARAAYAEVARAIGRFEPVTMVANPADVDAARALCGSAVQVRALPIDDAWTRDTGPTWLVAGHGELAGVDWPFNGWGKYEPFEQDAAVASHLLEWTGARRFEAPIVLEGGAFHGDGQGTLLTTRSVVLNPNRNPGLTQTDAEAVLRAFLGAEQVVWLDGTLEGDHTDGHVDNLACFARPGVVVALTEVDPSDSHFVPLRENLRRLETTRDASGRQLEVVPIQQPRRRDIGGERLSLSYVNHYIANGAVIVPVFDDPYDGEAAERLARLHPERQIVPVPALEILRGGGGVHCITQQEPLP